PTLCKGKSNRVLLFSGQFNPPHIGHKLLLSHGFFRSAYSNIIAAFVLPMQNRALRAKLALEKDPLILTREQRTQLWDEELLNPWNWVFSRRKKRFRKFWDELVACTRKDGFHLEPVLLCGPDYISMNKGCKAWRWGYEKVIVAEILRPPDFIMPCGTMVRVS
ncbi:hypothetical protein BCR34DRAFT_433731, partial [Clohesyomyces aquaticus]